jgi:hypothetical protein
MAAPLLYAVPGALKAGFGLYQTIRGAAMRPKRPEYKTPSEIGESLALSRQQEAARMPGISYAEDRLRQQSAQGMFGLRRGATTSNQLMSGLSNIQMQSNIAQRGLLESESKDYYRRLGNLQRSLGISAQYADKEFEANKMQPFQDKARTKAALIQAGLTNLFTGGGEAVMQPMYADYMQSMAAANQQQMAETPLSTMKSSPGLGLSYTPSLYSSAFRSSYPNPIGLRMKPKKN